MKIASKDLSHRKYPKFTTATILEFLIDGLPVLRLRWAVIIEDQTRTTTRRRSLSMIGNTHYNFALLPQSQSLEM